MCGIVFMAGKISPDMRKSFNDLLDVCQVRGRDSTGVIKVNKDGSDATFIKQVGPPSYLTESRQFERFMADGGEPSVLVGHCRHKTSGEVSRDNAHPFEHGDIIGVHNGTLLKPHEMPLTRKYGRVDSEMMFEYLSLAGPEEVFGEIDGAWTAIWWNKAERRINFIRNNQRPFSFIIVNKGEAIIGASEAWMLNAALRARGVEPFKMEGQEDGVFPLPTNTLWSLTVNAQAKGDEKVLHFHPSKQITPASEKKPKIAVSTAVHTRTNGVWYTTSPKRGGEVANPFKETEETFPKDDLDEMVSGEKKKNTELSNVTCLHTSATSLTKQAQTNSSQKSTKPILSLPEKSSLNDLTKSNAASSGNYRKSTSGFKRSEETVFQRKFGVSYRRVAGVDYISCNKTGVEYSQQELLVNTKGECSFCHTSYPDPFLNVGAILTKETFLCFHCVTSGEDETNHELIC